MAEQTVVVVGPVDVGHAYRVEALPFPGEMAPVAASSRILRGSGADQAAAASLLGVRTILVGCVGEDDAGRESEADLRTLGVDPRLRHTPDAPTGNTIVWRDDEGQSVGVVEPGANAELSADDVAALGSTLSGASVCIAGGLVPTPAVRAALEGKGADEVGTRILDLGAPDPALVELLELSDVVVTDARTAEGLLAVGVSDVDDALAALRGLKDQGAREPVLFLGPAGAVCFDRGRTTHVPLPSSDRRLRWPIQDAFKGALAALLAEELEIVEAVEGACRYASLVREVGGDRSTYPDRAAFDAASPED